MFWFFVNTTTSDYSSKISSMKVGFFATSIPYVFVIEGRGYQITREFTIIKKRIQLECQVLVLQQARESVEDSS